MILLILQSWMDKHSLGSIPGGMEPDDSAYGGSEKQPLLSENVQFEDGATKRKGAK